MTDQSRSGPALAPDPEAIVRARHAATINAARAIGPPDGWRAGRPLRLLLAGYVGALNTGADVRSGELVRQLRAVLGIDSVEFGVLAMQPKVPGRLGEVHVEMMDGRSPSQFVSETCDRYDGVLACEGSLFTSTFSNDLTALLAAFLGYASAQGKLAIAVGAEADRMTDEVAAFVREQCRDVVIFTRNNASLKSLAALGLTAQRGTDTGWTFVPKPARPPHELLRELGWDGSSDLLVICPSNPFWWPVKLDPRRAVRLKLGGGEDPNYYGNYSFHRTSMDVEQRFTAYLDAMAQAVKVHCREHDVFPVVVGMEPLDRLACCGLAQRLDAPPPLMSGDCDADVIVAVLRAAQRIVSMRLHAIILSMGAGVPPIGVAFDGRISALMEEDGLPELVLQAHDVALGQRLGELLEYVTVNRERIKNDVRRAAAHHLRQQGEMGQALRREVARRYPDFALPQVGAGWRGGLPAFDPDLVDLAKEVDQERTRVSSPLT